MRDRRWQDRRDADGGGEQSTVMRLIPCEFSHSHGCSNHQCQANITEKRDGNIMSEGTVFKRRNVQKTRVRKKSNFKRHSFWDTRELGLIRREEDVGQHLCDDRSRLEIKSLPSLHPSHHGGEHVAQRRRFTASAAPSEAHFDASKSHSDRQQKCQMSGPHEALLLSRSQIFELREGWESRA